MFLKPHRGLTLGGGGARGGAHLGALRALTEFGYQPELVVGSSIGGFIAALLGAGWDQSRLETYFTTTDFGEFMQINRAGSSLLSVEAFAEELRRLFGDAQLEELTPKVALMAADLKTGQRVALTRGPVTSAILATTAVPGVFPAVACRDFLLVDGGINDNLPVQATYQLGADRTIAIDLGANSGTGLGLDSTPSFSKYLERALYWLLELSKRQQAFDTFVHAQTITFNSLVAYQLAVCPPDAHIRPDMPGIGLFSTDKIPEAIRIGEEAARAQRGIIRRLNSRWHLPRWNTLDRLPPIVIGATI